MYPNEIDKFTEKLNKIDNNTYTIEEEVDVKDGAYEGELQHDNISESSIRVYTGSKLTGEKIENFILSTPSKTPWKLEIKIFSDISPAYITYETQGDTVEAEDINKVQESIINTQKALNDETDRAIKEERNITDNLDAEIKRAKGTENNIANNLNNEVNRSKRKEEDLSNSIDTTNDNLDSEINRSKNKENNIETNMNNYKQGNNAEIQKLKEKDSELDRKKANKTYVDTELNKRYLKEETFTKEEVLRKIQNIIGTAPEALDTLQEIAKSLNNDPDFAATMTNELSKKVDKVQGKDLTDENFSLKEKQKLVGIETGANKYIHPASHSANMIIGDETKRFVSDTEKAKWNAKETPIGAKDKADKAETNAKEYTDNHKNDTAKHITATERSNWNDANSKKHTHSNKSILNTITQTLIDAWNNAVEHIKDNVRHITFAERTKWNSKAEGIHKHKKNEITDFPTSMTPEYTAIPSSADLNNFTEIGFYGTARIAVGKTVLNKPSSATGFTLIVAKRGSYTTQILIDWIVNNPCMWIRSCSDYGWGEWHKVPFDRDIPTKVSQLSNDKSYVTATELGNAGFGDMMKSIYDTNNDGKVDVAETADNVKWSGITGKPNTFKPSSHEHDKYINKSGDVINGTLKINGKSISFIAPKTSGGHARGVYFKNPDDAEYYGGIGVLGDAGKLRYLYFGLSSEPWHSKSSIRIYADGTVRVGNKVIAVVDDIPTKLNQLKGPLTWNDLKGV